MSATVASAGVAAPAPSAAADRRLAGVDGLRAVAALWVVLFHVRVFSQAHLPIPLVDLLARSGSTGVSLFLVISGFCLYLPFANGRATRFRSLVFFRRRFGRLMPAFYASLGLALLLETVTGPRLGFPLLSLPQAAWQVVTHGTMTHAFFPSTFYAVNGAYWSLALEWQLYLALPLLIIGIRRIGLTATLLAAVAVNITYRLALAWAIGHGLVSAQGPLSQAVLPNLLPGRWAEFVLGMVAAELYRRSRLPDLAGRRQWLAVGALVVLIPAGFKLVNSPLSHLVFGLVFFLLLSLVLVPKGVFNHVFSWTPLVALGLMSYSLYLVHQPLVQAIAFLLRVQAGMAPQRAFLGTLLLAIPLVGALAWLLFFTVERRTLHDWEAVAGTPAGRLLLLPERLATTAAASLAGLGRRASMRVRVAVRAPD